MKLPFKVNAAGRKGLNHVINNDDMELLALDLLVLHKNDVFEYNTGDFETAIVPFTASVEVEADGVLYGLQRKSVFVDTASAICAPRDTKVVFFAKDFSELAICKARTDKKGSVIYIPQKDIKKKIVGKEIWQRDVIDIIDSTIDAAKIVLGETFNKPAGWSSFPPHKHDTAIPGIEAKMEEIYLFRLEPSDGFGMQTIYGRADKDYTFKIIDYDAVTIPWGYHPVSVMPGYKLYYLWFLAGEGRILMPNTDPKFKWLEGK